MWEIMKEGRKKERKKERKKRERIRFAGLKFSHRF
jgi:hypothetical protein